MARRRKQNGVTLTLPQPFQTPHAAFTTRAELIDVLSFVDVLHEATIASEGLFYANTLAEEIGASEPAAASSVVDDIATAVAVGIAVHRVASSRQGLVLGPDQVDPLVCNVLAWAAMEQALDAPERHGPWIAYATHLGQLIAMQGNAVLRPALAGLQTWRSQTPAMSHSAYFEHRLVLDIGSSPENGVVARNYLPPRPAGIEHAHDVLLFQTACDDYTERVHGRRVHGTTPMRNVFRFTWKAVR